MGSTVSLSVANAKKSKIYLKLTHTDQYLNWDSNHHLEHLTSVVHNLLRRVEMVVLEPLDREKE